jgi:hypothetical protein
LAEDISLDMDWNTDYGASVKWETKALNVSNCYCRKLGNTNLYLLKFDGAVDKFSTNVNSYTMRAKIDDKWAIPLVGSIGTSSASVLKSIG